MTADERIKKRKSRFGQTIPTVPVSVGELMEDGFIPIMSHFAARIINERLGCTLTHDDLLFAAINVDTNTIQFEDRNECIWKIDTNGRRCRRFAWVNEWTEWEHWQR